MMHEGRARHDWAQTSEILALIANVNRDPKRKPSPFLGRDFNPHAPPKPAAARAGTGVRMRDIRHLFPGARTRVVPASEVVVRTHG